MFLMTNLEHTKVLVETRNITQNVGKEARSIHTSNSIRVWEGR